jgi:hypothetical protein
MNRRSPASVIGAVLALVLATLGVTVAVANPAAADAVYPVMNTSEYPPDGINFRSAPDWNARVAITGYGVYAGEHVRLKCWELGSNVPRRDGGSNTIWYQTDNVSRPSVAGRANSGLLNAHFVNDGTGPNQVAPGVTRCGSAAPTPNQPTQPAPDWKATTDRLLFSTSMGSFISSRFIIGGLPGQLNWSTDNCSSPSPEPMRSAPLGYDFHGPCWRHDFGYRNYKGQGRFTEDARQKIDDNFLADMNAVCNGHYGWDSARGVQCRQIARIYYSVVRGCGANPAPACPERIWKSTRTGLRLFALING